MRCWRTAGDDVVLDVFVQARASRNRLVGPYGDRVKIAVSAAPVDGGANRELIRFVAALFNVSPGRVSIDSGLSSRRKRVRVRGVSHLPQSLTQALTA